MACGGSGPCPIQRTQRARRHVGTRHTAEHLVNGATVRRMQAGRGGGVGGGGEGGIGVTAARKAKAGRVEATRIGFTPPLLLLHSMRMEPAAAAASPLTPHLSTLELICGFLFEAECVSQKNNGRVKFV